MLRAIKKFGGVDLHQWLESRSLQSHFVRCPLSDIERACSH